MKNKPIHFAEIGVAMGKSACLWDEYFTHPDMRIHMFDRDENFLKNGASLVGPRVIFSLMDVEKGGDISRALTGSNPGKYDVIIDDSSHNHADQIRIIKEAFPLLKQGGILVIEDIFRSTAEEEYTKELCDVLFLCSSAYFVMCEHTNRWSPGWDNDKLLVLVKG
jgi:predicted O-methyltransferase YrrM